MMSRSPWNSSSAGTDRPRPRSRSGWRWRPLLAGLLVLACPLAAAADPQADWARYRQAFVQDDGRVVDTGNGKVSHTESQGWGLLFAVNAGDREAFDRMWGWTSATLLRKDAALFSWKYDPASADPVPDKNNATDGDLLIAWALQRAGARWNRPELTEAARRTAVDVRRKLTTVAADGKLVLLPGLEGFVNGKTVDVNLSYYVFPAIDALKTIDPAAEWERLLRDGVRLIAEARYGQWNLPPDWLRIPEQGAPAPSPDHPPRFGYDAIRVPLYLAWGRRGGTAGYDPFLRFWNEARPDFRPIAWIDLNSGEVAGYNASNGILAVAQLVRAARYPQVRVAMPGLSPADDYYSASLILLSRLAGRDLALGPDRVVEE